jgi:hypothetical protein
VPITLEQFVGNIPSLTNEELVDWIYSLADSAARNAEAREEVDPAINALLENAKERNPEVEPLIQSFHDMNRRLRAERDACRGDACRLSGAIRIMSEGKAIGEQLLAMLG